jgi:hypothetical protein
VTIRYLRAPLRYATACGARKALFLSLPTLFGFAFARLQGGLNNSAPAALGQRRNKWQPSKEQIDTRRLAGCLLFIVQGRRGTEAWRAFARRACSARKGTSFILTARVNSCPDTYLLRGCDLDHCATATRFLSDSVSVTDLDAAMLRLYVECNVEALDCRGGGFVVLKKNNGKP